MKAHDYAELGLIAGLEVHQQLLTSKKLFCRCPAGLYTCDFDVEILRHMRPTLSELGEYDGTALMEFKTRKNILYRLHKESVCTYEMDDAPPFGMDEEALEITLEITLLLGLQPVDEIHVIRKQYLDGSIPTGFQRTAIFGVSGEIPVGNRKVGITQLSIEEDSCREVSDEGHWRTFRTDRLGMPLIEVVTDPDMRTPEEVAETCQAIRELTRANGRVRRGSGAAREDVNVSVRGGTRVEIKGVSRIPWIPPLVHYEAFRQKTLLEIRDELLERGLDSETWKPRHCALGDAISNSDYRPAMRAVERGEFLSAVLLPGFRDVLMQEIQPGIRFLREIRDRVRVVACLDRLPNLVCSEQTEDGPSPSDWKKIRKALGDATGDDPVILVWGDEEDLETAVQEIGDRCREALVGVPAETRQSFTDGTTRFERILPGPDRMYPDTDLPPIPLSRERWKAAEARLPERPWLTRDRLMESGLSEDMSRQLIRFGRAGLFFQYHEQVRDRVRLARLLTSLWRRVEKDGTKLSPEMDLNWYVPFQGIYPVEADELALQSYALAGRPPEKLEIARGDLLYRQITQLMPDIGEPRSEDPSSVHRYYVGRMKRHLNRMVSGKELSGMMKALIAAGEGGAS
ncbi:MAG: Glu-tRNA(Gln) amidotransferase subunit GatE [Candidatus Krumholzibacteria bacterium]|nr:Glu-tRNA(Gln) amidotransferase subunit GatE [Candidatus Krumholzibacteria bacterium]